MTYENATVFIEQLKTQLGASAAWVAAGGLDANIHYPVAGSESEFPLAILGEDNITYEKILFGAQPIPTGSLNIFIADTTSVGEVEQLCRDISREIAVDIGLANLEIQAITPSNIPSEANRADGRSTFYECEISLTFGLTL